MLDQHSVFLLGENNGEKFVFLWFCMDVFFHLCAQLIDLNVNWCVKGSGYWQHEYQEKPNEPNNMCYTFKVESPDGGNTGSRRWIGSWEVTGNIPVKLLPFKAHPLKIKSSPSLQGYFLIIATQMGLWNLK